MANGSDGTVSRIDPSTDAVIATIDLRGSSDLVWNTTYAVAVDGHAAWVATGPHDLVRIDPATSEPAAPIDVGRVPVAVAVADGTVWVATTAERALRVEPRTRAITAEVPVRHPVAMAAGEGAVWVADARGSVWCIEPDTAAVAQTIRMAGGHSALSPGTGRCGRRTPAQGRFSGSTCRAVPSPTSSRWASPPPTSPSATGPFGSPSSRQEWAGYYRDGDAPRGDRRLDRREFPADGLWDDGAERSEPEAAVAKREGGGAAGLKPPAIELLDRGEDGDVEPLDRARQHVRAEAGLVDVDADRPDVLLPRRLEGPQAARARHLEYDTGSPGDLAEGNGLAFRRIAEVLGVADQHGDLGPCAGSPRLIAGDEALHGRHRLAAHRADRPGPVAESHHPRRQ